jgi:hypothetical protein
MSEAFVSKAAVAAVEALRPPGYLDAIRASAARETETHYVIPRDRYNALCKVFQPRKPGVSVLQKARNFAASAAKHAAAGMPQATEEQVAARFAICQGCEHFDGRACRQCGCPVVRERKFLSKLSWANESCPVGKWGPVSS